MSRIHDALQKAIAERGSASPEPAPAPVVEAVDDRSTFMDVAAFPASATARVGAATVADFGEPSAPPDERLSFEDLVRHARKPKWNPKKSMLFFDETRHYEPGMEEFRTLRSRLYQIRNQRPLKTVMIASAMPAEGKSFVASNLAQAFVRQHGRRALLIDGDLRASRLHRNFNAPSTPGLSDYLEGTSKIVEVVQQSPIENLMFIPAGNETSHPAELIANGRLKVLIETLTPAFDWIVLDSPPSIAVSDASRMAELCDGILMVVSSGQTDFEAAQRGLQEFKGKPVLGAVLNRMPQNGAYKSYYYSQYGAGARRN